MRDLVDTTEMYLRTVYELEEEGITPLRARIAERLDQSGPTVSQTVARMERDGLLVVEKDRSLSLTTEGRERATRVMRKHRLAERLLVDVLGMDIGQVHDEACRWEHVMSDAVEQHVVSVLNSPKRSPFGNPIPALDELGAVPAKDLDLGQRAVDVDLSSPVKAEIVQIHEILQLDPVEFAELVAAEAKVGAAVELTHTNEGLEITGPNGKTIVVDDALAHAIRVRTID
ncbi:metal-dependent transcriptional regulator [Corynebacterium lubricantis]|uniref:metal-dependent transcriptional regulator n=1 Tax=Corynebacterium lubricantis TaxID=541095 RepID=UPI0003702D0C|nr:metal-dependent transcriptional regulator [Corynebacterium lubricantis]